MRKIQTIPQNFGTWVERLCLGSSRLKRKHNLLAKKLILLCLNSKLCAFRFGDLFVAPAAARNNSDRGACQVSSFPDSSLKSIWLLVNPKLEFIAEAPDTCLKPGNLRLEFPEFEFKVLCPNLLLIANFRGKKEPTKKCKFCL